MMVAASYLGGYPVTLADAQINMPATVEIPSSGLPINIANNPRFTTMQGEHGLASSTSSCGNGDKLDYPNVDSQQSLSNNASYSNSIDMPDCTFETAVPAPKQNHTSLFWFPERRTIYYRSTEHQGGWAHINSKKTIPQMLGNLLKKKARAKVIADCRVQHFDECRREIEALANNEFDRIVKEHAAQLDSQRILAEKAIEEARGDRESLLKSIRGLEDGKKVVESEAKVKDERIRDLKADLQKHCISVERAVRKAQAHSEYKSDVIMDLKAENASLKEQVDNVKEDLKASTVKVEDLEMALLEQRTEAKQQAQSVRNLNGSVNQLKSIVAEQAQKLVDGKNVNEALGRELTHQKSEKAALEDKIARLREKFYPKRQIKRNLVKHMEEKSAVDLEFTAEGSAGTVPTVEVSTAMTIQDKPTLSKSRNVVIPAVASAPTVFPIRNITGNLILLAYCFLFGNLILYLGLASVVVFSGTKIFFSASSNLLYTGLSAETKTGPSAIGTDIEGRKIASKPGGLAWREEH